MRPLIYLALVFGCFSPFFGLSQSDTTKPGREIDIVGEKKGSKIQGKGIQKSEILNDNEFKKAACCTLSESFETTNTIEVSNADGVSGIRQIELLGLAGKYVQMTKSNMPTIRGLSVLTGLSHIPGPMVSEVHIAKGTGSVSQGFEGMTGGINYALKNEPTAPRLFLNAYLNNQLRGEANAVVKSRINNRTFNHTYLHYGGQWLTMDQGKDGMTDMPLSNRVFVGNQITQYNKKNEWNAGFSYVNDHRRGGDIRYFDRKEPENAVFHFNMSESKTDAWLKFGLFLNESATKSIGQVLHVNQQETHALLNSLRDRHYKGSQQSLFYSATYASPEEKTISTRSGVSITADKVKEQLLDSGNALFAPNRTEINTGMFTEWVFKSGESSLVLGMRGDYNSIFGWLITPRIHGKLALGKKGNSLHMQAGRGVRTAWLFSENLPLMISNRRVVIDNYQPGGAYGQKREDAMNIGFSYVHPFSAFGYPATFSVDAFHTRFFHQIIADRDQDPATLFIAATDKSRNYALQSDIQLQPHRRIEIKMSYRYIDNQQPLGGAMRLQPLLSKHRMVSVVSFKNRKKWFFDAIVQWNSPKRLPLTLKLQESEQMPKFSPSYTILNIQIRKDIGKKWEWYMGGENLLNVVQKNPVLSAKNPEQPWFDAAFAWGPVNGINVFAGFRLKLH